MKQRTLLTSESVTEGHPDKIADRISDSVLDFILTDDPDAHVACETFLTTGLVLVGGEITTSTYADVPYVVRRVLRSVGYDKPGLGFNYEDCSVLSAIKEQSTDIASAVDHASEVRLAHSTDPYDVVGAGDQGIIFGYARSDTDVLMPLPIMLAHRLTQRLAEARKDGTITFLRPDGKSQVTIEYEGDRPVRADTVLIAAQHDPDIDNEQIKSEILKHVVRPVLGNWLDDDTTILVNSSGRFVIGGPASDTGVTGRKVIVDTYGGFGSHGGGAFSGKDPTKVDRSGSYMARYVAKHVVAAGLASKVEVQVAYAIGRAAPLAVNVDSQGTGTLPGDRLREAVLKTFDFRPGAIIDRFELKRPMYEPLSAYGHFGRTDLDTPWEILDLVEKLKRAVA
ncbi:methionine adenosyltransferase [Candidatus Bipolaricaulota bacterium]|nr:methionine adenosyltransferase [Candidatus Bipolaricaulota bacterium]